MLQCSKWAFPWKKPKHVEQIERFSVGSQAGGGLLEATGRSLSHRPVLSAKQGGLAA
jgi:hypothetical protein